MGEDRNQHNSNGLEDYGFPVPDPFVQQFLVEAFQQHGVSAFQSGNWVVIGDGGMIMRSICSEQYTTPSGCCEQVEFVAIFGGGLLNEAFGGMGSNRLEAIKEACGMFQAGVFHVLLSVAVGVDCEHVKPGKWLVEGVERKVTFGNLLLRGSFPAEQWPPIYEGLRKTIEASQIPTGLHWVRVYYAYMPGRAPVVELRFDNIPAENLQQKIAKLPWPRSGQQFYSARIFFMLQDATD